MSLEEKIEIIRELENNFPVINWMVGDIRIWPLIRSEFVFFDSGKTKKKVTRYKTLRIFKEFWSTLCLLIFPVKRNNLVVTSDTKRSGTEHSFINFLDLKLNLKKETISVFEANSKKDMRLPQTTYKVFHLIYFFDLWTRYFANKGNSLIKLEKFDEVVKFLEDRDSNAVEIFSKKKIEKSAKRLIAISSVFERILKRSSIRRILMESYYGIYNMALCASADKLGIPVVEFQHGTQGRKHIGYSSFFKLPTRGYKLLPNVFWVWSKMEANNIDQWSQTTQKHKSYIGGYTNLIRIGERSIKEELPVILFTMQPIEDCMPTDLVQFIIAHKDKYDWYFRLHPGQVDSKQEIINLMVTYGIHDIVDIETLTNIPITQALNECDCHITLWSSCVLEASMIGVPSIVIHKNGYELFKNEFNKLDLMYLDHLMVEKVDEVIKKRITRIPKDIESSIEEAIELCSSNTQVIN